MKKVDLSDFGLDYFSSIGRKFQERENRIRERTICFKVCSKCGKIKSIFKFSVDKRNTDGRIGICKICRAKGSLEYYYLHRDKILIRDKEYSDNHKKDRSIYNEKYREDHREKLKLNAKNWYKKNRKRIKKRNLQYYREHEQACQARRSIWIIKNREKIKEYNREYNLNRRNKN